MTQSGSTSPVPPPPARPTRTGGRPAIEGVIPGRYALSVGKPNGPTPAGWRWTALSSVARLETGHTPSRKHPEYWDGDVPWIGIRDATNNHGRTLLDTNQHTNDVGIANSSARVLPKDTVCLSRTASVGYVVVMGRPMATSQDFVNWVCSESIDYRYLKYILLAEHETFLSFASGTTHQTIYFPEVKAFHVLLPPVETQRMIASTLSALDDLIENDRRRVELLERVAQTVYREWFVYLRYPGHEYDAHVDSSVGPIPEGWEPSTLGEIASLLTRGVSPKYAEDGAWKVVNQRCIRDGRVGLDLARRHEGRVPPPKVVRSGDVLVNSTGVGTLGRVGVIREEHDDLTVDSHVTIVRPQNASMQPWFGLQMLQRQTELEAMGIGTTGQTELGRQAIGQLAVLVPTSDTLRRFGDWVSPLLQPVSVLLGQSRILASLRDQLLPKLITGQIDVSSLDIDALVESVA